MKQELHFMVYNYSDKIIVIKNIIKQVRNLISDNNYVTIS